MNRNVINIEERKQLEIITANGDLKRFLGLYFSPRFGEVQNLLYRTGTGTTATPRSNTRSGGRRGRARSNATTSITTKATKGRKGNARTAHVANIANPKLEKVYGAVMLGANSRSDVAKIAKITPAKHVTSLLNALVKAGRIFKYGDRRFTRYGLTLAAAKAASTGEVNKKPARTTTKARNTGARAAA